MQIQLDVSRLEHGMYKLDLLCTQQPGAFVQLTQAFEAFVIQIVHTNMIAITSKVICSFIVKVNHLLILYRTSSSILLIPNMFYFFTSQIHGSRIEQHANEHDKLMIRIPLHMNVTNFDDRIF